MKAIGLRSFIVKAFLMATFIVAGCTVSQQETTPSPLPMPNHVPAVARGTELTAARAAFEDGDFGDAAVYYLRAFRASPSSTEACLGLAASYDWLYRFDSADRVYADCRRLGGESVYYLNNIGFSFFLRGDLDRAERYFLRADASAPGNPVTSSNLEILRDAQNS